MFLAVIAFTLNSLRNYFMSNQQISTDNDSDDDSDDDDDDDEISIGKKKGNLPKFSFIYR